MKNSATDKHVLVIGGAGYIGSVLTRRLLQRGYRVRVLDALLYDNEFALRELIGQPGYSFVRGDFCQEPDLCAALDGVTDVVLLAALVGDPVCRKYPDLARHINETSTLELIDRLNGSRIDRFVFMSTCSNYGLRADDTEATESSPLNPQSLYAETKVRIEQRLLASPGEFGFAVTVLRSATAYGLSPRMRFDLTINEFTRELALGRELEVYDADTWRPYCHVDDIADAVALVLDAEIVRVHGEVFNVGESLENYTKRMIVDRLCKIIPQAVIRFREGRVDPRNYRVSFKKINSHLSFHAQRSVEGFLLELVAAISSGHYQAITSEPHSYTNESPHPPSQ
jgi:nucleoside-diphosphate-sugar epimerase